MTSPAAPLGMEKRVVAVFPSFVFDRPNHPITKVVYWIMPYLAPVLFALNYIYPLLQMQLFLLGWCWWVASARTVSIWATSH